MMRIDHFGILAPFYEHFIQPKVPEKLLELLNLTETGLVLDAGGGTGRIAQFLSRMNNHIVVVDQSLKMLRETQKKKELQPICSLTEALPLAGNTFDRIIMVDAFHHVAHQTHTAKELWRILKPGGRLIIEEPNIDLLGVKLLALAEKVALMRSHFFSSDQIMDLFQSTDAHVKVKKEGSTVWVIVEKEDSD